MAWQQANSDRLTVSLASRAEIVLAAPEAGDAVRRGGRVSAPDPEAALSCRRRVADPRLARCGARAPAVRRIRLVGAFRSPRLSDLSRVDRVCQRACRAERSVTFHGFGEDRRRRGEAWRLTRRANRMCQRFVSCVAPAPTPIVHPRETYATDFRIDSTLPDIPQLFIFESCT